MNIPILFLWIFIHYGGYSTTATNASKKLRATKELNELCGEHVLQSVNPILKYVDQLQKETEEINNLRKTEQQLKMKEAEVKNKDDLITSTDKHIQDLQITISELRDTNRILKQHVESVNREVVEVNTFVKEELKSKGVALKTCESSLGEYKLMSEIHNKINAEKTSTISQLKAELNINDQTLRESQKKLIECQVELSKQNEIIQQKEQELSKLGEQMKKSEEIPTACTTNYNGIRNVLIPNFDSFPALCNSDIAGSGWIVIQQRINGGENFYRDWETYKNGFGNFTGDFFIGLEKIHRLTKETPHELYIHMETFDLNNYERNSFYARYDNFRIAGKNKWIWLQSSARQYRLLSLGSYSGNADQDRMRRSEHQQFSTFDSDNDEWNDDNCAVNRHAGWWLKDCARCNLNGKYYQQEVDKEDSNWWDYYYSLKTIKMMIRPRGN